MSDQAPDPRRTVFGYALPARRAATPAPAPPPGAEHRHPTTVLRTVRAAQPATDRERPRRAVLPIVGWAAGIAAAIAVGVGVAAVVRTPEVRRGARDAPIAAPAVVAAADAAPIATALIAAPSDAAPIATAPLAAPTDAAPIATMPLPLPAPSDAEPSPPAAPCALRLRSTPPGAAVLIDDRPAGVTPLTVDDLPCDEPVTVVVAKRQYELWERSVTPRLGKPTAIAAKLRRPRVRVEIWSQPHGARAEVNGREIGTTPVSVELPAHVRARITVTPLGGTPQRRTIVPRPGPVEVVTFFSPLSSP